MQRQASRNQSAEAVGMVTKDVLILGTGRAPKLLISSLFLGQAVHFLGTGFAETSLF